MIMMCVNRYNTTHIVVLSFRFRVKWYYAPIYGWWPSEQTSTERYSAIAIIILKRPRTVYIWTSCKYHVRRLHVYLYNIIYTIPYNVHICLSWWTIKTPCHSERRLNKYIIFFFQTCPNVSWCRSLTQFIYLCKTRSWLRVIYQIT